MENNTLEKLRKIKELAEHGIGGEKTNAIRKLKKLLKKYNLKYEEVFKEEPDKIWAFFTYTDQQQKTILFQCLFRTAKNTKGVYKQITESKIALFLTAWEALELTHMYTYYRKLWKQQIKDVLMVFIAKHNLCRQNDENKDEDDKEESRMDPEELAKRCKLYQGLQDSMYKSTRNMIEDGQEHELDMEI